MYDEGGVIELLDVEEEETVTPLGYLAQPIFPDFSTQLLQSLNQVGWVMHTPIQTPLTKMGQKNEGEVVKA